MEAWYQTGDSRNSDRYYHFDGKRPVMTGQNGKYFDKHGVDITADLNRDNSNESDPPPSEPWDKDRYRWIGDLGKGTQASVSRYLDLTTGRECAIKRYELPLDTSRDDIIREIAIMATLSSDPDASLYMILLKRWHETDEICSDGSNKHVVRLVMHPVASQGNLLDKLNSQFDSPGFKETIDQDFPGEALLNLAKGLAMIHKHSVRHKDINTENILVHGRHSTFTLYSDFGISLYFDPQVSAIGATSSDNPTQSTPYENTYAAYAAPELLDGKPRSTKSDVFSLGCVIWEILVARSVAVLKKNDYVAYTGFGDPRADQRGEGYAKRLRDGSLPLAFRQMRAEREMREHEWILDVIERMVKDDPNERMSAERTYELASSYDGYRDTEHGDWDWRTQLRIMDEKDKSGGRGQVTWTVGTREMLVDVYRS